MASRSERDEKVKDLEVKLQKLMRERSVFAAKARLLAQELEHYRGRELRQDGTVEQLLERQHEMAVMLNRSNMMLARAQDAAATLSLEFGELARALPSPEQVSSEEFKEQVEDKVQRINDLFKKTGQLSEEIAETLKDARVVEEEAAPPKTAAYVAPPSPEPVVTPPPEPVITPIVEPAPQAAEVHPEPDPAAEAVVVPVVETEEVVDEPELAVAEVEVEKYEATVLEVVESLDEPEPEPEPEVHPTVDVLFGRPRITNGSVIDDALNTESPDISEVINELADAQEQADAGSIPEASGEDQKAGWRRFLRRG